MSVSQRTSAAAVPTISATAVSTSTASAIAATSSATAATESSAAAATTAALSRLGLVDLDLLAVEGDAVHLADRRLGCALVVEGHEGIALAGVVDISHLAKLLKLGLNKGEGFNICYLYLRT